MCFVRSEYLSLKLDKASLGRLTNESSLSVSRESGHLLLASARAISTVGLVNGGSSALVDSCGCSISPLLEGSFVLLNSSDDVDSSVSDDSIVSVDSPDGIDSSVLVADSLQLVSSPPAEGSVAKACAFLVAGGVLIAGPVRLMKAL